MSAIKIHIGDADTFTVTVTGLANLSGYDAKMYITKQDGTAIATLADSNITGLVITFQLVNETSKAFTVGRHKWEVKIWDANDHVYTPDDGDFIVDPAINSDPS